MPAALMDNALDQLFRKARSQNGWKSERLPDSIYHSIYELMKFGPTSANCCPARFVWVTSIEAKRKLAALARGTNTKKILAAPCTVIIGYDLEFPKRLPQLFPHAPEIQEHFRDPGVVETTAFRNSSLQGAYLMIAARALGLDCGPMSGFDNLGVDRVFFAATSIKSNFLCSLGYGAEQDLFPRHPRLTFDEAGAFA
ncbi:MAG TPA: malonic semialdehyde reductase [Alphaproteobacteria bacterium]|nr:malonic semialdehyde reductase [Alphaproteobacteria bacterium]